MADYGWISKGLHFLALGNRTIAEVALDLELTAFGKKLVDPASGRHIFVVGFARAGTTILTRALHSTGHFGSLTYKDMPFVLAPNCWSILSAFSSKEIIKKERIHGDGIYVNHTSPEAFDEVFWRICSGDDYIKAEKLEPYSANSSQIKKYQQYVGAILYRYGKTRYLSKNNNNILRIKSIVDAFPNAFLLVPFRCPLEQSTSLLNQHNRLLNLQENNSFIKHYMNWLGHHEFGSDHKPFNLTDKIEAHYNLGSIDYWLEQWILTYDFVLKCYQEFTARMILICYEQLCDDRLSTWDLLLTKLNVDTRCGRPDFRPGRTEAIQGANPGLLSTANDIYNDLIALS